MSTRIMFVGVYSILLAHFATTARIIVVQKRETLEKRFETIVL